MVDQPNGAPTAAPVTAPVANGLPAAAPAISDDTMIPVIVDRQTRQEPLSKLKASYQTQTAAEARLEAAKAVYQEHKEAVDLGRRVKSRLATDPEGAILEMHKFAESALGRRIKLPGSLTQDDGDAGLPAGGEGAQSEHTRKLERRLSELEARHANMSATQQVENTDRLIEAALDVYPAWRANTPEAKGMREYAKLTIAGLHAGQPDVAVADHASELHSRMAAFLGAQVTQVRDQRQQRAQDMPLAPTAGGTPELTAPNPDGWGTRKALRDGTFQKRLTEFMGNMNRPR